MALNTVLHQRSGGLCELCAGSDGLSAYPVECAGDSVALCQVCTDQLADGSELQVSHWHCLNQSVWSSEPVVQVLSCRVLRRLTAEPWAQQLLETVYLDDEVRALVTADATGEQEEPTRDSNGAVLQAGDTVTLIKDLDVKGTSFTAKRGTAVRNISLSENPLHIEGRVNGTRIVIISKFVKRAG
ncbi:MAG: PhnA domain-containing protein [Spongiibacter sp.]